MTKDERFFVELYHRLSDPEATIDPYKVGKQLGYSDHLTKNILRFLMQANFVKGYGSHEVALTTLGRQVAKSIANIVD